MTDFDFQAEAEQIEQGISAARAKLLQAAENRAAYQGEQSQKKAPVYYDGRNKVKSLGANGPIRPRGFQSTAPLGVGDRVSEQDGLVQSTPRVGSSGVNLGQAIRNLKAIVVDAVRALVIEDIDVVIDTGNDTYPIITSSSVRYTVLAITASGTGTGTLSPTVGGEIAVGGTLDLTLAGNDDTRWSATIRLRRRL